MNYVYYLVRKKDNQILGGANDVVSAINMADETQCACFVLQGCIISEIGQDPEPEPEPEQTFEPVPEATPEAEPVVATIVDSDGQE